MNRKTDKKIIITILFVLLFVATLGWFAFFYETKKVQNTADTIQKKKLESLVLQEKRDKIIKLKKDLKDIERYKNEMDKMLIKKEDAVIFLRSIEEIASSTSNSIAVEAVDLSKLKIGQSKKTADSGDKEAAKGLTKEQQAAADLEAQKEKQSQSDQMKKKLGFTIELAGTYSSLVDFLDKMENLPYFISVYSMDLVNPSKSSQPTAAAGGVLSAGSTIPGQEAPTPDKNIKMTMLVIVNTNDGK